MKAFYEEYKDDYEFLHLGAKLSRKHNIELIQRVKDRIKHKYYMRNYII